MTIGRRARITSQVSPFISFQKMANREPVCGSCSGREPDMASLDDKMFSSNADSTAPLEASATMPKLSSSDVLLPFFKEAMPVDNDRKNGTANAPVVAPEASNAMEKNSVVEK